MQLTMQQTVQITFSQGLKALDGILDKAIAFAEAKKIEPSVLLNARLAPDMFAFTRQVQIACDFAKATPARLTGVENPKFEDNETSFPELKARIAKTLAFLNSIDKAKYDGCENRDISVPTRVETLEFKGLPYLIGFALPNFYFHMATAYDILRHNGVELGKRDFLARS